MGNAADRHPARHLVLRPGHPSPPPTPVPLSPPGRRSQTGPRRPLLAPCITWPRWALDRDHLFGGRRGPLLPMVVEGSSDEGLASRREWSLAPTEGHPAPQPPIQSRTSHIREAPSWTLTSGTVPRSRSR